MRVILKSVSNNKTGEEKVLSESGAYIIGFSDCGESVCAASGRISTQKGTALEIFERSHDAQKNSNLISKVIRSGHTSTIEHMLFNLAFENVSVVVEQFMIEFRLASFTVKSRRYVDFSDSGYYVPQFESANTPLTWTSFLRSIQSFAKTAFRKRMRALFCRIAFSATSFARSTDVKW